MNQNDPKLPFDPINVKEDLKLMHICELNLYTMKHTGDNAFSKNNLLTPVTLNGPRFMSDPHNKIEDLKLMLMYMHESHGRVIQYVQVRA